MWREAIRYALARRGREIEEEYKGEPADMRGLRHLADKFLTEIEENGNIQGYKELADRVDGKAVQSVELGGPDGGPIEHKALPWSFEEPGDAE